MSTMKGRPCRETVEKIDEPGVRGSTRRNPGNPKNAARLGATRATTRETGRTWGNAL